jgi:hypothetical protein
VAVAGSATRRPTGQTVEGHRSDRWRQHDQPCAKFGCEQFYFLVNTGSKLLHCKQRFGLNFGPGILLATYQNAKQHHHFFFRWVAAINIEICHLLVRNHSSDDFLSETNEINHMVEILKEHTMM